MLTTKSNDGTTIAYEKIGHGPNLILVTGALSHRTSDGVKKLALELSKDFTVYYYDRRGRGDSTDTKPYTAGREIEDLEALVNTAGVGVFLFGSSSGAALALNAAEVLGPEKVTRLAIYEPPYGSSEDKQQYAKTKMAIDQLVADKKPGEAVATFFESLGTSAEELEGMKQSPAWKDMENVAHTLVYDYEVLGDSTIPVNVVKRIAIPTQILVGEKSFDFLRSTADTLAEIIPHASRKTLKGQTHQAAPTVLAPALVEFFNTPIEVHA